MTSFIYTSQGVSDQITVATISLTTPIYVVVVVVSQRSAVTVMLRLLAMMILLIMSKV